MDDTAPDLNTPLEGLGTEEWLEAIEEIAEEHGHFQFLGPRHYATFVEAGRTLLVTFETIQNIQARGLSGHPLGFDMVRDENVSHLCLIGDGQTWFRDPYVYAYFDRLTDDGFFEDFDRVVFYGAGSCGYAAAAFSVAAPGATVLVLQPQATLDPRLAGWDRRFMRARRVSFADRYGFAPDMTEAADRTFVLYDPLQREDAMHAALFRRDGTQLLRLPSMGAYLEDELHEMGILKPLMSAACDGSLTPAAFFRLYRARRDHLPYLDRVLRRIERQKRPFIKALLCANVGRRLGAPRYLRKLDMLVRAAEKGRLAG